MNPAKKDIVIYYLFSFLIGFYIANGTTVLFERVLGFSFSRIFTLGAIYMLMFVIFEVPSGALADLVGRKKTIVAGCLVLAVAALATGLSNTFGQVLLSFFVWALGFSLISGADEALLYDRLADHNLYAQTMGKSKFFALAGTALAGVLGPYLFSLNFRFPYLSSALPFFLGGAAMIFFGENHTKKPFSLARHLEQIHNGIKIARQNRYVLWAVGIMSLVFAVWYNLSNSYQPYLVDIGFTVRQFSFILPALFILEAGGGWWSGKLYETLGENKIFVAGILGIAAAVGLAGFFTVRLSLLLLLLYSLLLGLLRPVASAYANRHIDSAHRATVISVQAMASTVAAALSLFLFGFLTDRLGLGNLFIILGAVALVLGALLLMGKPNNTA